MLIRFFCFIFIFYLASIGQASILKDLRSLGGNDVLFKKAKVLTPEKKITIVQSRITDRTLRHEFNFEASHTLGGDALLNTGRFGLNYQFHIMPYLSVGLKGHVSFNKLSSEGDTFVQRALDVYNRFDQLEPLIPDIDYEKYGSYLVVNWYPIYGKFNLYDLGIGHYDVYLLAGGGGVWLRRNTAMSMLLGGGFSFWLANRFSLRLESRYETYKVSRLSTTQAQRLHITTLSLSIGYIL